VGFEPDGVRERSRRRAVSAVFVSDAASNCFNRSLIRPLRVLEAVASTGADFAVLNDAWVFAGPDTERFEGRPVVEVEVEDEELPLTLVFRLDELAITPSSVCKAASDRR
jgi:hypothetical protein